MALIFPTSVVKPMIESLAMFVKDEITNLPEVVTARIFNEQTSDMLLENYELIDDCFAIGFDEEDFDYDGMVIKLVTTDEDEDVAATRMEFFREIVRLHLPDPSSQIIHRVLCSNVPDDVKAPGSEDQPYSYQDIPYTISNVQFDKEIDVFEATSIPSLISVGVISEMDRLYCPVVRMSVVFPISVGDSEPVLAASQVWDLDFTETDTVTTSQTVPFSGPISIERIPEIKPYLTEETEVLSVFTEIELHMVTIFDKFENTLRSSVVSAKLKDKTTGLSAPLTVDANKMYYMFAIDRWDANLRQNRHGILPYTHDEYVELVG